MKFLHRKIIFFLSSISILILLLYLIINQFINKPLEIINFIDSNIHKDFEIEIANNLNDINNYLKDYLFIENFLLKRKNNTINVKINLKRPFAYNNLTKEVIFFDNSTANSNYFNKDYLNSINLIDISKNSIHINRYLFENFNTLSSLFKINQIEYIDERRYNLILSNGIIVMLPKVIDSKLLNFIENNIDLIGKSTNYKEFLDFRNFHNKTIRLK